MPESFAAPRWRIDVGRAVATGAGGGIALALIGTHHAAALTIAVSTLGAVLGLLVALGAEWIGRLRSKVVQLQDIERRAEAERAQANAIQRQLEWRLEVAQREAAIESVGFKVYADAFQEVKGYERIPGAAMIARMEVHKQARGLNLSIEPPKV